MNGKESEFVPPQGCPSQDGCRMSGYCYQRMEFECAQGGLQINSEFTCPNVQQQSKPSSATPKRS